MPAPTTSDDPRLTRLVDAASSIFFGAGAAAVTMDRVAAEAGMSKKTVYQLVESKSALLTAVMEQLFTRVDHAVQAVVGTDGLTARDRVVSLVEAAGQQLAALGPPQAELRRVDPPAWSAATALRMRAVEEPLDRLLAVAAERGELRDGLDPQLVRFVVLRVIEMLAHSDVTSVTGMTVGQVLRQVAVMFVDGAFDAAGGPGTSPSRATTPEHATTAR